ncbi:ATP synthase F(0) complex subunit B1, mitochondrial [Dermatophagoides pteronyssinus]|uniref:ATP synthase subunit b n=2 Tax=Dermatophagoides pteronyssinus TaxID=6956 RepID=A0A6P6Y9J6_DERPT|nr:ATP synthase subunit b, mitochondrial-like [Dermatophagoides pteronyssinus]KAH9422379.1 ATP synthase F(0) complex subunit B1, mitochondrial [Dermatophagoides pteronyssinus]
MLVRNFLQAARLLNNSQYRTTWLLQNHQSNRMLFMRAAPPLPEIVDDNEAEAKEFDPKQNGSLEEFLNLRFGPNMPTILDEKSERRDLVNFPRPVRADFPEPCRLGIIPESWFQMFYEKTGVTGPYCFFWGFLTFLLSKEWLVFEHELLVGIEATIILGFAAKTFGPAIRNKGGAEVDATAKSWDDWQKGMIQFLNDYIKSEESVRDAPKHHSVLFEAKRENVQLQLEAEYRRRQMEAYQEVRRRLNYLVAKEEAEKQFQQNYMVQWIIDNVAKSITPAQEKDTLKTTLAELKRLSDKTKI